MGGLSVFMVVTNVNMFTVWWYHLLTDGWVICLQVVTNVNMFTVWWYHLLTDGWVICLHGGN